jgi:enterochelin esterase-like enzyme
MPPPPAGVTALYAAIHYPHVFGSVLAESPSL